jgi:bacteriorhodopsin
MADIDVVPKRRSNAWVWVMLLALLLVAILVMFFLGGRAHASAMQVPDASTATISTVALSTSALMA